MRENRKMANDRSAWAFWWQLCVICGLTMLGASAVQGATPPAGTAPVAEPIGGLGIDGDLLSATPTAEIGDWVAGRTGAGVLSATGRPLNPATTFHFIDAYGSSPDQIFGSGPGLKWMGDPRNWTWTLGGASGKTDIHNGLMHVTVNPADGHMWIVVAADRASTRGDSYIDFEFLQNELYLTDTADGKGFYSAGPHGGRTVNDLVLSLAFVSGGSVPDFYAYRWLPDADGGYAYHDVTASLPTRKVFLAASKDNTAVPFGAFGLNTYKANAFAEAALDLTELMGNFDRCLSIGVKTIMVKTKTSPSSTAAIVDFIDPIQYSMRIGPSADAGPNQTTCIQGASTAFQLHGTATRGMDPITSTSWSVVDGIATIDDPTDLETTARVSSPAATLRLTLVQGQCIETSDVVLTVRSLPAATVVGVASVCPQAVETFTAPPGLSRYAWSIEGNGAITAGADAQRVTVKAGAECNTPFTLTLAGSDGACSGTGTLTVQVVDAVEPGLSVPADLVLECADPQQQDKIATWLASASGRDACSAVTLGHSYSPSGFSATCGNAGEQVVTFTATDHCQNVARGTAKIIIQDTTEPAITAPADLVLECADPQQEATIATWLRSVRGADTCGAVSFSNSYEPGRFSDGRGNTGEQVVTFRATDACGNWAEDTAKISIRDTTKPSITCPADLVLECADPQQEAGIATWLASVSGSDTCGTVNIVNDYAAGRFSDGRGNTGEQIVTFTATDESGNTTSCTVKIIIRDITKPTITCPANLVLECADPLQASNIAAWLGSVTGSDTCGTVSVANNYDAANFSNGCGSTGEQTVTFTATDASDNATSFTAKIIIQDTTRPALTCPANLVLECADPLQASTIATWLASVTGSDACGSVSFGNNYSATRFSDGCGASGEQLVTFTATDECGNSTTGTASIIIRDTTAPRITCPGDLVLECADPNRASRITAWLDSIRATDACGTVTFRTTYRADGFSDGCGNTGEQTVTFTATDRCGNTDTCSAKVIIRDTTPPALTAPRVAVQCVGDVPAPYATLAAFRAAGGRATDSCSAPDLAFEFISGTEVLGSCPGTVKRVYRVTDECGNSADVEQTIVVDDTIAPTVTCPPAVTFEMGTPLDQLDAGTATVTDNCSQNLVASSTDAIVPSSYLIKFYAADPDTNSAPYLPTYLKLAPRNLACPETSIPMGRAADPLRHAVAFDPASGKLDALTSLGGEPMVLGQIVPFEAVIEVDGSRGPENGTIEFSAGWSTHTTSNDRFGYDKSHMVYCAFVDPVDPGSVDPHRNARIDSFRSVLVNEGTVNEKIQGTFQVSGLDSGDRVVIEIWLVLDSARPDHAGGTIAADLVSAQKMTSPPEPISVGTQTVSIGNLAKIQPLPPPGSEPPAQPPLPPQPPEGTIPGMIVQIINRTWAAVDTCANRGSCVQRITLVDNTPPVMTIPADLVLEYPADTSIAATGTATATDSGSDVTISHTDYVESACGPTYFVSREWIATDRFGHRTSAFQFISVRDTTAPRLTVPPDVALQDVTDTSPAITGIATAEDSGGPVRISHRDTISRNATTGTITRTWNAVDACGNAATGRQLITIPGTVVGVPVITAAPRHQNSGRGNNTILTVTAEGPGPLSYQWRFNGQPIAGATDSTYRLAAMRFSDAGIYSVVVTGPSGPVAEASAIVNVLPKLAAHIERQRLTVVCEDGFILQTATSPGGHYVDVPNAGATYSVPPSEPQRFFRLRPRDFSVFVSWPDGGSVPLVEVAGSPGLNCVLQGSSNFVDWTNLAVGTAPFSYLDTRSEATGLRLYRVVPLDTESPLPSIPVSAPGDTAWDSLSF